MWPFRKFRKRSLLDKGVVWVRKNLGEECVDEFRDKYEKIQNGVPIGGFIETAIFLDMIETIKREG